MRPASVRRAGAPWSLTLYPTSAATSGCGQSTRDGARCECGMSANTSIEWTDATWNPIRGVRGKWSCVKVSPGCANCYAERLNVRFGGPRYAASADALRLDYETLIQPLRWKRP